MRVCFLLITILLGGLIVSGQILKRDTLILEDGLSYWKGMEIQVGVGTDQSTRNYKTLYIGTKWAAKNNLTAEWTRRKLKVSGFLKVTMDRGYGPIDQYILVMNAGNKKKVYCDIEEAQSNGEIVEKREPTIGPPPPIN